MKAITFIIDSNWNIDFSMHFSIPCVFLLISIIILLYILVKFIGKKFSFSNNLEIDKIQLSLGKQTVSITPNFVNIDIAYKIWIELETRKVGLPIDLENDVIVEVYNSWYEFLKLTREIIKQVPSTKFRHDKSTQMLIEVTINILNAGLRTHLTCWQTKFRKWYSAELTKETNVGLFPQEIQQNFPNYKELVSNLIEVNNALIEYKEKMHDLAFGKLK